MTKVAKIIGAKCDVCGKEMADGEEFKSVTVTVKNTEVGIQEYPETMTNDGSSSMSDWDLCSKCFESFLSVLKKELRDNELRFP